MKVKKENVVKKNGKSYSADFKMLPEVHLQTGCELGDLAVCKVALTVFCEK